MDTEEEARARLAEFSELLGAEPKLEPLPNGDWLAMCREKPWNGVVLKPNGVHFTFWGAMGKLVPALGPPVSPERLLGSVRQGRYQLFANGLGIWEDLGESGDLGFPIARWPSPDARAQTCTAIVAFFDLRGFTTWAGRNGRGADEIQRQIEMLEEAFQHAFTDQVQLFAKSTGDGFMVVSEAGWFDASSHAIQPAHAKKFCVACAETVRGATAHITGELAIGCGITTGEVTRLYLLGRLDYIGPAINEASKIQAVAYNELIVSPAVKESLEASGEKFEGQTLPGKGWRMAVDSLLRGDVDVP